MKHTAFITALSAGILCVIGLINVSSANMSNPEENYAVKQMAWIAIGSIACWIMARLDYHLYAKPWPRYLLLTITFLSLILVLAIGTQKNGARRWLFFFQPSVLAKLTLICVLCHYCSACQSVMATFRKGFLKPSLFIMALAVLIFLQPDWGTAGLLIMVGGSIMCLGGCHLAYLFTSGVILLEVFLLMLFYNPLRMNRIMAFLDPERFRLTTAWQTYEASLALGSGWWLGAGYGNGIFKGIFLPEHHTDFILAVLGEEWGFIGASVTCFLFILLLVAGFRIAWNAPDTFGQLLAAGITLMIGFQASINMGVVLGCLPNKGIPLPFISYGGSDILIMLIFIGILINIALYSHKTPVSC